MRVSVITPCSRPEDLSRLIEIYHAQDYQDKELSILMDVYGVHTAMSVGDRIWQWGTEKKMTVGAKRNELVENATGEIVIHFDSDDYYAPDFITQSVNHLLNSGADLTGLSTAFFFQNDPEAAWVYEYKGQQPYVIGSGMCYYKSVWERNKFKDISEGEDRLFLGNAGKVSPHNYVSGFCAFIHGKNTCSHKSLQSMKSVAPQYVRNLVNFTP